MSQESQELDNRLSSLGQGRDLTTGSIPRHLIAFSIPMLIGNAAQMGHSVVNAYWVGKGLGSDAMAAATVSMPVIFVLVAVAIGLTMASGILASQSYGAKDWDRFKRVVQSSVVLIGSASVLCLAASYRFAEPLLVMMNTAPEILPMAVDYLRIFIWCIPFAFGMFLISSLLRGVGDSKTPLYFQVGFLTLNFVLDPLLIMGWSVFPKMGLNGAAVASVISSAGGLAAILIYLRRKRHIVVPELRDFKVDWPTSQLTIKIGVPSMFQHALISISLVVIIGLVNNFGKSGTAAFGVASRIDQLAFLPALTLGTAVSTLAGQNIGAGYYHRVHEVFKWGIAISCGMILPISLLFITLPGQLMGLFIDSQEVIDLGIRYLRIIGAGYVLLAVLFVSNGIINGAGRTLITSLIALVGLWIVRLPLAGYLSSTMDSLDGIWYAMVTGFGIGMVLSLAYYYSGKWKSALISKLPGQDDELLPETHVDNLADEPVS